jgi:starch phosphorylase
VPTWASAEAVALWNQGFELEKNNITPVSLSGRMKEDALAPLSDTQLWDLRCKQRTKLVESARRRLSEQQAAIGAGISQDMVNGILDPNILTLGFARRFAEYKRPSLLLRDPERFARILTDAARPTQLVLAGKAHPADEYGKSAIKQWHDFVEQYGLRNRIVFLADYDMQLTQMLVRGADVWVNTPRRPWEASGTSGMKILVNGGLNLSELDGWWAEAYKPEVGWGIGNEGDADPDAADAERL